MAGVFIDIPGIGNVEAKNAATEATLKDILRAIQGSSGRGGAGGGTGGGGASGAGGGGGAPGGGGGGGPLGFKTLTAGANLLGRTFGVLNKGVGFAAGILKQSTVVAAQGLGKVGEASTELIRDFANVGDSLTGAAGATGKIFEKIPIVGGVVASMFGAVAEAVEKSTGAYQAAAGAGASFGGSVNNFARAATEAGMTLEKFGAFVAKNGVAMGSFGVTTEDGAKRFVQVSKALRTSGSQLYALGYSTEQINQGLANYGRLLRIQGSQGNKTNAELAAGAKKYLKEMDMLAKITGEERAVKEAAMEATAKDGQFRAAMAGLGPEVEQSANLLINSMPNKEMETFAKDLIANGTATTDANRLLLSQMPQLGAQLAALHKQTQKNVAISADQLNQTLNIGRKEGPESLKRIKFAAAANDELHGMSAALGGWNKVTQNAVTTSQQQQNAASANTDKQNEAMEKAKQTLAAFSNQFTMFLAQSGILGTMMSAFEGIATIIQKVVVPIFQWFSAAINTAADFVKGMFTGTGGIGEGFKGIIDSAKQLLSTVGGLFEEILTSIDWKGIFGTLLNVGKAVFDAVNTVVVAVQPIFLQVVEVGMSLFDKIAPIITDIASLISLIATRIAPVLTPIVSTIGQIMGGFFDMLGGLVKIIKGILTGDLSMIGEGIKQALQGLWDRITGMFQLIGDTISGFFKGIANFFKSDETIKKEEAERLKVERDKKLKDAQEKAAKGDTKDLDRINRVEQQKKDFQKVKEEVANKKDKSQGAEVKAETARAEDAKKAAAKAEAAKTASIDYSSSSEALLKQFATAQKSPLVPGKPVDPKAQTTKQAETAKTDIEKAADAKKAEAAKAEADAKAKADAAAKAAAAGKKPSTQETAEDLLTQLNMNIGMLIGLTKTQNNIIETQLRVQRGLAGDTLIV